MAEAEHVPPPKPPPGQRRRGSSPPPRQQPARQRLVPPRRLRPARQRRPGTPSPRRPAQAAARSTGSGKVEVPATWTQWRHVAGAGPGLLGRCSVRMDSATVVGLPGTPCGPGRAGTGPPAIRRPGPTGDPAIAPASKMSSAGSDWQLTNPATQIAWGWATSTGPLRVPLRSPRPGRATHHTGTDRLPGDGRTTVRDESADTPVLFSPPLPVTSDGHPSTGAVADAPQRSTRMSGGPPEDASCLSLLRVGFTDLLRRPDRWWSLTPPFHPYPVRGNRRAVCSLWHCPAGRPGGCLPPPLWSRTFSAVVAHRRDH